MKDLNSDRPVLGINWAEIFRRHPELEPPGYRETCAKMRKKKEAS